MMTTKFIIHMKIPTRPDLDYFYCGQSKSESPGPVFDYRKPKAKRYEFFEEADRDMRILKAVTHDETLEVITVRCRV